MLELRSASKIIQSGDLILQMGTQRQRALILSPSSGPGIKLGVKLVLRFPEQAAFIHG